MNFIKYLETEEIKDKKFISSFDDRTIMFDVNLYLLSKIEIDISRIEKVIKKINLTN
jgi:hypothetical protein